MNSPLVKRTSYSKYYSTPREFPITRITPHMFWGQVDLNSMCAYFADPDRVVSANYGISKDGEVCLSVDEKNRAWTSNNIDNDGRAVTIEIASDRTPPYAFTDAAYQATIALCTDICSRNGKNKLLWIADKAKRLSYLPAENEMVLTKHNDFFKTDCPGAWMEARMGDLAEKVTAMLQTEEDISQEPIIEEPASAPVHQTEAQIATSNQQTEEPPVTVSEGIQGKDLAKMSMDDVLKLLGPIFVEEQKRTGLLASVMMAQFITECGGNSELLQKANNGFGMKATISGNTWPGSVWDGTSVYKMSTQEWNANGTPFTYVEFFRAYVRLEDSIKDHSQYLLGAKKDDALRYDGLAGCTNARKAAEIIYNGGYCTAPDYVDALLYYIELYDLDQWNHLPEKAETDEYIIIKKSDWNALKASYAANAEIFRKYEN